MRPFFFLLRVIPVAGQFIRDGFTNDVTVLLQRVERILDCLIDGPLNGATHFLNLVDTAARLRTKTKTKQNTHQALLMMGQGVGCTCKAKKVDNHLKMYLVWIRNVDCGHVKTTFIKSWSFAELLDNLHHYSLQNKHERFCELEHNYFF